MKAIKLTWAQVSFLYNNLDVSVKGTAWAKELDKQLGDYYEEPQDKVFSLYLDSDDDLSTMRMCMHANTDEILRQLKLDVRCHSMNPTSNSNTIWCLGMTSDVIWAIDHALDIEE